MEFILDMSNGPFTDKYMQSSFVNMTVNSLVYDINGKPVDQSDHQIPDQGSKMA